jgi:hypothetical protein
MAFFPLPTRLWVRLLEPHLDGRSWPRSSAEGCRITPVCRASCRPGPDPFPEAAISMRKSMSLCGSVRQHRIRGLPHMLVRPEQPSACYGLAGIAPSSRCGATRSARAARQLRTAALGSSWRMARVAATQSRCSSWSRSSGVSCRTAPRPGPPPRAARQAREVRAEPHPRPLQPLRLVHRRPPPQVRDQGRQRARP